MLPKQKWIWKVHSFIIGFKLKYFCSVNKQIAIITIIMQTQAKLPVCFTRINNKVFF